MISLANSLASTVNLWRSPLHAVSVDRCLFLGWGVVACLLVFVTIGLIVMLAIGVFSVALWILE
jgi:hypothetical protein